MALSLIRNNLGNYFLDTADTQASSVTKKLPSEFEAYLGGQKTELVGGTTLGAQTQQILEREAPGQFNLEYDPETGQYKQKGEVTGVQTQQFKPITSLETGTSQAVQPQQTALEKVQSIISATPYKSGMPDIDVSQLAGMFSPQQMSTKQQLLNTVLSAGSDIATSYILDKMGIGGGGIPSGAISATALKGGAYPGTTYITPTQAGLGGAAAAAIGTLLAGGSAKKAAKKGVTVGAGTAIGTAVGGPVGGVVGGIIGDAIGGGKIVCTMMNESYGFGNFRNKIWLKHSQNLAKEYEIGYHTLFLPLVNFAKKEGKVNKIIKKILEHIAIHRTIDIRQEMRGKKHLLGRVYRKILEPVCYITGKIKLWL